MTRQIYRGPIDVTGFANPALAALAVILAAGGTANREHFYRLAAYCQEPLPLDRVEYDRAVDALDRLAPYFGMGVTFWVVFGHVEPVPYDPLENRSAVYLDPGPSWPRAEELFLSSGGPSYLPVIRHVHEGVQYGR